MFSKFKVKSEFSRNVLTLMTGTTIAQAIPIAISPILTRIYTPEDFGVFALYIGIVGFIAIIVTARYEMAIVLPKTDEAAINIVALSFIIMLSIVTFITLAIFLFSEEILVLLNAKEVGNLLYLVPLSVFLSGLYQIFNYWANRKKNFKTMSSSQIGQSVGVGIGQSGFGFIAINGGLIFGNLLGRFVSAFILVKQFILEDKQNLKNINKLEIIKQMKKHKDFPLVNSLHVLSEVTRISGSVILISSFFGTTILGFYALSLRILQIPMGIISAALGNVLYKKFVLMYNDGLSLYPLVKKIILYQLVVSIPIFTLLYLILPDLFRIIFGDAWKTAGEYSQLLLPYMFFGFILSSLSEIPIILGKQKLFFYISLIGNIYVLLIISVGDLLNITIEDILKAISYGLSIEYLYLIVWILSLSKQINKRDKECL